LSIVGRRKEVIRSGGESIFPVEIERVLLEHAAVREASVLGVPDPHWGEAVAAVIVPEDGATLGADEVVEYLKTRLASYKKPRHVLFLSRLPRTASSQQVHKSLLREMVLEELARAEP
jgi:fatty-acyl-CoA synthase